MMMMRMMMMCDVGSVGLQKLSVECPHESFCVSVFAELPEEKPEALFQRVIKKYFFTKNNSGAVCCFQN